MAAPTETPHPLSSRAVVGLEGSRTTADKRHRRRRFQQRLTSSVVIAIGIGVASNRLERVEYFFSVKPQGERRGRVGGDRRQVGCSERLGVCQREQAEVLAVASDPHNAAIAYGRRTGNCAICGRELTNHASIDLGIGPICAEKYGWM